MSYGWITEGENKELLTTATQKRFTTNDTVDIKSLAIITRFQVDGCGRNG